MVRVKICGIKDIEIALKTADAGADFIGFVFASSKRQVSVSSVKKIINELARHKNRPKSVGVFVNTPANEINRVAKECNLDWVQLSGDEPWSFCLDIENPLFKVIHVSQFSTPRQIISHINIGIQLLGKRNLVCLLDTGDENLYGGTGKTFNWEIARAVARKFNIFVAGGLTGENVTDMLQIVNPWGVDVSSGVESNGVKDIEKIKRFIHLVKNYQK